MIRPMMQNLNLIRAYLAGELQAMANRLESGKRAPFTLAAISAELERRRELTAYSHTPQGAWIRFA